MSYFLLSEGKRKPGYLSFQERLAGSICKAGISRPNLIVLNERIPEVSYVQSIGKKFPYKNFFYPSKKKNQKTDNPVGSYRRSNSSLSF